MAAVPPVGCVAKTLDTDLLGIGVRLGTYLQVAGFGVAINAGIDIKGAADASVLTGTVLLICTISAMFARNHPADFGLLSCASLVMCQVMIHHYYTTCTLGPHDDAGGPANLLLRRTMLHNGVHALKHGRISQIRFWVDVAFKAVSYGFNLFLWGVGVYLYHDETCGKATTAAAFPGLNVKTVPRYIALVYFTVLTVLHVVLPAWGYACLRWSNHQARKPQPPGIAVPASNLQKNSHTSPESGADVVQLLPPAADPGSCMPVVDDVSAAIHDVKAKAKAQDGSPNAKAGLFNRMLDSWAMKPKVKGGLLLLSCFYWVYAAEVYIHRNFKKDRYKDPFSPGQLFPLLVGVGTLIQLSYDAYRARCGPETDDGTGCHRALCQHERHQRTAACGSDQSPDDDGDNNVACGNGGGEVPPHTALTCRRSVGSTTGNGGALGGGMPSHTALTCLPSLDATKSDFVAEMPSRPSLPSTPSLSGTRRHQLGSSVRVRSSAAEGKAD